MGDIDIDLADLHRKANKVTMGDVVDFLGDPDNVEKLRNHLSEAHDPEDSAAGTVISPTVITLTVAASC